MKKTVRILSLILVLVLFVALFGCNKKQEDSNAQVLLSFESAKELQSMTLYRGINKVELNKDTAFITHGTRSLRICPKSEVIDGVYESSYIAFMGGGKYFSKTDFNDVNCLSVDIYNPTNESFYLVWGVYGNDSDYYEIKKGWNTLYKYVDREMLYADNQGYVKLISFYFEGREEEKGSLDIYMDNLCFYTTDAPFEKLTVTAKQIIGFETSVEKNVFEVQKKSGDATAQCVLSINKDLTFVRTGTGSLKITAGNKTAEYPDKIVFNTENSSGGVTYTVPKKCVLIKEPYSEELRKAASERAKTAGRRPPKREKVSDK